MDLSDKQAQLERQVERGSLFTHSSISEQYAKLNELSVFLYSLIDILIKKGITPSAEIEEVVVQVRREMDGKGELLTPRIALRHDPSDEAEFIPVNCNERIPICHAVCCKLDFALTATEVEEGKVKWDLGRPYFIRKRENACCTHLNTETSGCSVYEHRPGVCRVYSCANDTRIWKDFERMELNHEWIEASLSGTSPKFRQHPMMG